MASRVFIESIDKLSKRALEVEGGSPCWTIQNIHTGTHVLVECVRGDEKFKQNVIIQDGDYVLGVGRYIRQNFSIRNGQLQT